MRQCAGRKKHRQTFQQRQAAFSATHDGRRRVIIECQDAEACRQSSDILLHLHEDSLEAAVDFVSKPLTWLLFAAQC